MTPAPTPGAPSTPTLDSLDAVINASGVEGHQPTRQGSPSMSTQPTNAATPGAPAMPDAPTSPAIRPPRDPYEDACARYLAFIASARQREDRAYDDWRRASTPTHRNEARTDYLRAYDEVADLSHRLARLQRHHAEATASTAQRAPSTASTLPSDTPRD